MGGCVVSAAMTSQTHLRVDLLAFAVECREPSQTSTVVKYEEDDLIGGSRRAVDYGHGPERRMPLYRIIYGCVEDVAGVRVVSPINRIVVVRVRLPR